MILKREDFSDMVAEICLTHRETLLKIYEKIDAQELPPSDKHNQKVLVTQRAANLIWSKSYPHVAEIICGNFDKDWIANFGNQK